MSDKLPDGVAYISASGSPSVGNGFVNWSVGEIPPRGTVTLTLKVEMPSPGQCAILTNNASVVWMDAEGRVYGPAWDAFATRVCPDPLIRVDKGGPLRGTIGQQLTFIVSVTNIGGRACDVTVWDDLPFNLTLLYSNYSYSYDESTGRVSWKLGSMDPGETITIELKVNVSGAQYDGVWVANNVYANWTCDYMSYGPTSDIHLLQLFVSPYAEISKAGPSKAYAGSTMTYTITIANPTLSGLSNVELFDYLPLGVAYVSSNPPGAYNPENHTVSWSIGELGPRESRTFEVTVRLHEDLLGGAKILDKALVRWPEGSQYDFVVTEVLVKPLPVGGLVEAQATYGDGALSASLAVLITVSLASILAAALGGRRRQSNR